MTDTVSNEIDFNDPSVVEMVIKDDSLSKLPLGSDALKAAIAEKAVKTDENNLAPAGDETEETDEDLDKEAEDDLKSEAEETEPKPKRPPKGMLKRIETLVEEKASLKREIEQLRQLTEGKLKQEAQEYTGNETDFDQPEPSFEDFDNIKDYVKAQAKWEIAKTKYEESQASMQEELKVESAKVANNWRALEDEVKKEFRDYEAVVNADSLLRTAPSVESRIFLAESDNGPRVVYSLLSDEDLTEKFKNANPVQQVKILTRLEMQLESTAPKKAITTASNAPTPPRQMPRSGESVKGRLDPVKDHAKMTQAEWDEAYEREIRARRGR